MVGKVGETAELEIPERAWEEEELVWNEAEVKTPDWIGAGLGRERASATMFSRPGTCTMELVNSAM